MLNRSDFVKHKAEDYDSNMLRYVFDSDSKIETTVIIPSRNGYRNGYLPQLIQQIKSQTYNTFELIIIIADPRPGRAINRAVCQSQGEFFIILDDDTQLGNKKVFEKLINYTKNIDKAGMIGVPNLIPKDGSFLIKQIMQQIPRRHSRMVNQVLESDLAEHPCCAIPRDVFIEVGGENELIPRGIDPFIRNEIRKTGYKIAVIPEVYIHHLPPPKLKDNLIKFYQNGKKAGYVNKFYPDFVVELAFTHQKSISEKRSNFIRIISYSSRLIKSILFFQLFSLLHMILYLAGYLQGYIFLEKHDT